MRIIQFAQTTDEIPAHDEYTLQLLNKFWAQYGELDGTQLSSWTHEDVSPWFKTWNKGHGQNDIIPDEEIKHITKLCLKLQMK